MCYIMTTYGHSARAMITENVLTTADQSRRQQPDLLYARYQGKTADGGSLFRLYLLDTKVDTMVILKDSE